MPSISARAASSSTTRTRPRLGPFDAAVDATGTFCAVGGPRRGHPPGRMTGRVSRCPPGVAPPGSNGGSVAVVVALERALDGDADVVGLDLGQLGELHAEGVQVQPGDV